MMDAADVNGLASPLFKMVKLLCANVGHVDRGLHDAADQDGQAFDIYFDHLERWSGIWVVQDDCPPHTDEHEIPHADCHQHP